MVKFRGRSLVVAAAIGAALIVPAAALGEVNFNKHWCERNGKGEPPTLCGAASTYDSRPVQVFTASMGKQRRHFRICSTAPGGNERCISTITSKVLVRYHGDVVRTDTFRFNDAFPHRLPGTYELTWNLHGSQIGRPLRFRLPELGREAALSPTP